MVSSLRWKLALVVAIIAAVTIGFTFVTDRNTPGNHLGYGALIAAARDGIGAFIYFTMRSALSNHTHRT